MNSRPLYPISNYPKKNFSRWQYSERISQYSWNWCSKQYLDYLEVCSRGQTQKLNDVKPFRFGSIREDNTPPLPWPMGRIIQPHPGTRRNHQVCNYQDQCRYNEVPCSKIVFAPTNVIGACVCNKINAFVLILNQDNISFKSYLAIIILKDDSFNAGGMFALRIDIPNIISAQRG